MKNKFVLILTLLLSLLGNAQTAKDIIDRHIDKTGGEVAWKLLNSVEIKGNVALGLEDEYPIAIYQQRPNLSKTEIRIGNQVIPVEGYDGKKGYSYNYTTNKVDVYKNYTPETFDNDLLDYQSKGFVAKLIGNEAVEGKNCYKITLTKNVNTTTYFFDQKTYMLIREIKDGETLTYSNFQKVKNLTFPFRIQSTTPAKQSDFVISIYSIKTNKEFENRTFKF